MYIIRRDDQSQCKLQMLNPNCWNNDLTENKLDRNMEDSSGTETETSLGICIKLCTMMPDNKVVYMKTTTRNTIPSQKQRQQSPFHPFRPNKYMQNNPIPYETSFLKNATKTSQKNTTPWTPFGHYYFSYKSVP